jgi:hypothetical protein
MAHAPEPLRGKRGVLERLGTRIPGFRGYVERGERRAADQLLREHGAARLDEVARELVRVTARAAADEVREHEELATALDKLRAQLRFADRSYSAFFDEGSFAGSESLEALYAQDERVVEQVEEIAAHAASPDFSPGKLRGSLKRLCFALADRRNAILSLGSS